MSSIEIRWAEAHEIPAAAACYARNDYGGRIDPPDRVLAAFDGERVVAAVRHVEEEGHRLLRGMFIDEDRRGQGLGTRVIRAFVGDLGDRPVWLVCGPHLEGFYGQVGFAPVDDDEAPPHLAERAALYRTRYGPQVILGRPAGA